MAGEVRTETMVSAGGVAYRQTPSGTEVALIAVGDPERPRWQLPKGRVDSGESVERAAQREVREEAGIETTLEGALGMVDFWYYERKPPSDAPRTRFHKFVHFFLLNYLAGDVADHDGEVNEARWVPIRRAVGMLSFESERRITELARRRIDGEEDSAPLPVRAPTS